MHLPRLALALLVSVPALAAPSPRPNVLFLAVDDLRVSIGCYGDPLALTPHLDRFAAGARMFERAYTMQAVCGPARTAMLTGRLPDHNRAWHNRNLFRATNPGLVTLPQLFKQHGYFAQAMGKIFSGDERELDPASWSAPEILRQDGWRNYASPRGEGSGKQAPHLPFNAPKRYWDLHDPAKFARPGEREQVAGAPAAAYHTHRELGGYSGMPKDERVDPAETARLRHGYYACVSYVDAQIGKVLGALDRLGLADNTIVVLWGDHGFALGDAGRWCKGTNFELDTRVPLLIRVPGQPRPGAPTRAIVEYVDVYPTLAELAGLPPPAYLPGRSLTPILRDPAAPGREFALSQFSRPFNAGAPEAMGYSIRTATHRYTRWVSWPARETTAEELYDYGDPASALPRWSTFVEQRNLAAEPVAAPVLAGLRARMDGVLRERSVVAPAPAASESVPDRKRKRP